MTAEYTAIRLDRSGFPPPHSITASTPGGTMSRITNTMRAKRAIVEHAAAVLHSRAVQGGYAGLIHPAVCYGLCLVLDEIARHWRDLDGAVRRQAVQTCSTVLGNTTRERR